MQKKRQYGASFLEPDLSDAVVGCLFDVRNKYGRFHRERVYDRTLDEHLRVRGLTFIDKPRIKIYSLDTGICIATYIPDKLVAGKILLELKAQPVVPREEELRAHEYVRASEYEILYFVNFGEEQFQPRRFIYTNDRKPFLALRTESK